MSELEELNKKLDIFNSFNTSIPIRIVSTYEVDKICSAAIFCKILIIRDQSFTIGNFRRINNSVIERINRERYNQLIIFGDLPQNLSNEKRCINFTNLVEVYNFAKKLEAKIIDLAHITFIGQAYKYGEKMEVDSNQILAEAVDRKLISVSQGFRFFNIQTRPLFKVLQFSTLPFLPGITGSEQGALNFLEELGINPKIESRWRMIKDLSEKEANILMDAICKKLGKIKPQNKMMGQIYTILGEEESSPTSELKEFISILEACIYLDKVGTAIGLCLNHKESKSLAINYLRKFRNEILNGLRWFEINKSTDRVINKPGFLIIRGEDKINYTCAEKLLEILAKSNNHGSKIIMLLCHHSEKTKISIRYSGKLPKNMDIHEINKQILEKFSVLELQGTKSHSGGLISYTKENELVNIAIEILEKVSMEEVIID